MTTLRGLSIRFKLSDNAWLQNTIAGMCYRHANSIHVESLMHSARTTKRHLAARAIPMHVHRSSSGCLPPGCRSCRRGLQALAAISLCKRRRSLKVFQICDSVTAGRDTVAISLAAPRASSLYYSGRCDPSEWVHSCTRKTWKLSCSSLRQALKGPLSGDGALPAQM